MAWIESHQSLGAHPKTKKLARRLGCSVPQAVGHLQFLWWWALDYAPSGDLSRFEDDDIADAVLWDGDSAKLVSALVDAGFLDDRIIHDWPEYTGRLLDRREANAERKRMSRARHAPVTRTSEAVTGLPTQHNTTLPTEQNRTEPTEEAKRLPAPRARPITEEVILELEGEFPSIDVRAAAQDYLNWTGSKKHTDKVLGLRNQLKSEQTARKFARKGGSNGTGSIAAKFAAYG